MKKLTLLVISFCFFLSISSVWGQGVAINANGDDPNNSAILDVSSTLMGVLIPRMTGLQRESIDTPATGLMVYQSDGTPGFYYYNGTSWELIGEGVSKIDDLSDAKSDGQSVFLGAGAGDVNSGSRNVGVGINALNWNTSGNYNTANGYFALVENLTGTGNVAVGYRALQTNSGGGRNVSIGGYADAYNLNGSNNIILGFAAGRGAGNLDHSKSGNVFIGYEAGRNTTDNSDYNVFLGYQAGYNESGANKLYIENSISSSPLIYGEFDNNLLRINGTLDINNAYTLPLTDGSSGQILQTNGSGLLSWGSGGGSGATQINDLTDARTDTYSVFLGNGAGAVDNGSNSNVAVGIDALNSNISGNRNVAIGWQALLNNGTGEDNIALGGSALESNIDGTDNIVMGSYADAYNLSGSAIIIFGSSAGIGAGNADHTKSGNVIIGYEAGHETTNNSNYNVLIGYQAGYNESGANKLYIENTNSALPLIYGEFDNNLLRINGTLDVNNAYQFPSSDGASGQVLTTNGGGVIGWATVGSGGGATQINDLTDAKAGSSSVFLGSGAGDGDNGSDNRNAAVGINALKTNITGLYNSAFGYGALFLSTGDRNASFGLQSLYYNSSGDNNTASGFQAAYSNTTGSQNTVVGHSANYFNQEGSNNTILGYQAGSGGANHDKSGNILLGYQAGYNETGDNKLYIENSNSASPLIYGEFDTDLLRINGTLDVNNSFQFPTIDGSSGQVLKTNGVGALSWADVGGANEINDLIDGKTGGQCVFLGAGAGLNDNGTDNGNVAVGDSALATNTTGDINTAIGHRALFSNTIGHSNTAIGHQSLNSNSEGENNTATGAYALSFNTDGYGNTANGYAALLENDDGVCNTAMGAYALSNSQVVNYNTAIGFYALYSSLSGDYNTAVGYRAAAHNTTGDANTATGSSALYFNSTGSYNTINGAHAAYNNTTGARNTATGSGALYDNSTGNDNTISGYNAAVNTTGHRNTVTGSEALYTNTDGDDNTVYGYNAAYFTTGQDNVAIGDRALYFNEIGWSNTATGTVALFSNTTGAYNTAFGDNTLVENTIGDNNTAIGYNSGPADGYYDLSNTTAVGSFSHPTASNRVHIGSTSVTWIGGQVSWSTYSDERGKTDIREDVKGLDFIMKLHPVTYHFNKDNMDALMGSTDKSDYAEKYDIEKIKQSGFLAQEVESAAIASGYDFSGIKKPGNEHTPYSLSYAEFVVPLVKAVQEQQELIEELKQEIEELKKAHADPK